MAVDKERCLNTAIDIVKIHASAAQEKPHYNYLARTLKSLYEMLQELSEDTNQEE